MPRSSSAISLDTSSRTSVSASATRSSAPRSCSPTCVSESLCQAHCTCAGTMWLAQTLFCNTCSGACAGLPAGGRQPSSMAAQQPCPPKHTSCMHPSRPQVAHRLGQLRHLGAQREHRVFQLLALVRPRRRRARRAPLACGGPSLRGVALRACHMASASVHPSGGGMMVGFILGRLFVGCNARHVTSAIYV